MAAPRLSYLPRARAVTRSSKAAHADADMFAADMFAKCSSLQPKTLMVQSECSYEGLAYTCMHRKDQGADVGSGGLLDCLDDDSADVCRSPSNSLCVSKLKPSAGPSFALFPANAGLDWPLQMRPGVEQLDQDWEGGEGLVVEFADSVLLQSPAPDFSMPYNVITLTCTVLALFFGSIFNLVTRTLRPLKPDVDAKRRYFGLLPAKQ